MTAVVVFHMTFGAWACLKNHVKYYNRQPKMVLPFDYPTEIGLFIAMNQASEYWTF
jgi:hypothetical protein